MLESRMDGAATSKGHASNYSTHASSPTSVTSAQTLQTVNRTRDIEEEEYIYKVPCDPRDTISLRDSVRPERELSESAPEKMKLTAPQSKNIQLTELIGGLSKDLADESGSSR